ncbi:hypothetical protein OAU08_04250, partial [Porticoccaceae bacterium]|nr:hypothetical protein [Porticoccaceae bacterium]
MIKILQLSAIIFAIALAFPAAAATSPVTVPAANTATNTATNQTELSVVERMRGITQVNPRKWRIRSGCINSNHVRCIRVLDDRTAILSLLGKKKAVLTLASRCPGISKRGFSYVSDGKRLCTKHTR